MTEQNKKKIPVILVSDRYWIPAKKVDVDRAEDLYRIQVFDEKMCGKCEYKEERVSEVCLECDGFEGDYKLYKEERIDGKMHIGVPLGNRSKLKKLIKVKKFKFKDLRNDGKSFKKLGIEFNKKRLYKYQRKAIKKLGSVTGGVLKSAPRTGKTIMFIAVSLEKQVKVLVLTHQEDLIKQFIKSYRDPDWTNIKALEEFNGKAIVKYCKTYEDFKNTPICLATYQTFISKGGKKLLEKVVKLPFGILGIDEVHRANANCFSGVANKFRSKRRLGLTATPNRKDGKHFIVRDIIGPVVHETKAKPMPLKVDVIETGLSTNKQYRLWVYAMRFLERDEKRTRLIVKWAVKDLKAGRSIVIPVTTRRHVDNLVRLINRKYGKNIAAGFHGGLKKTEGNNQRQKVLDDAIKGKKVRCVIAMRSMLTGVNIPRWDTIYEIVPISNPPNLEQELLRVCTPDEGKKAPIVRWFVDDFGISRACFANCVSAMKAMRARLGGFRYTKRGAKLTKKHLAVYYGQMSRKRARERDPDDDYKPHRQDHKGNQKAKRVSRTPVVPILSF